MPDHREPRRRPLTLSLALLATLRALPAEPKARKVVETGHQAIGLPDIAPARGC